jgi:hypothetical protein
MKKYKKNELVLIGNELICKFIENDKHCSDRIIVDIGGHKVSSIASLVKKIKPIKITPAGIINKKHGSKGFEAMWLTLTVSEISKLMKEYAVIYHNNIFLK